MAKRGFRIIDAEPHLMEPFDLWAQRLPEPYRSQTEVIAPLNGHLDVGSVTFERVGSRIVIHPRRGPRVWAQGRRRFAEEPHLVKASHPHATPEVYLEGFDAEGIDVGMLMPTQAGFICDYEGYDAGHALAMCEAYNDWAHEFTQANPGRLKFWAMVPPEDAVISAREARRYIRDLGAVGITIYGAGGRHLTNDEVLEPLWEELDRLHAPIGFHGFGEGRGVRPGDPGHRHTDWTLPRFGSGGPHATAIRGLIFGGVLERYPNLRPVFMESGAKTIPSILDRLDNEWETFGPDADFKLAMWPSEYYRRQCYSVTYAERQLKYIIDYMGDDNLLFSTDYPHHDCPFPDAVNMFLDLEGVSDESKRKILWDNGAKIFGLEVAEQEKAVPVAAW